MTTEEVLAAVKKSRDREFLKAVAAAAREALADVDHAGFSKADAGWKDHPSGVGPDNAGAAGGK